MSKKTSQKVMEVMKKWIDNICKEIMIRSISCLRPDSIYHDFSSENVGFTSYHTSSLALPNSSSTGD